MFRYAADMFTYGAVMFTSDDVSTDAYGSLSLHRLMLSDKTRTTTYQRGIGHQAAVVERDLDPVGVVAWQHLLGAPFPGSVFCYKTIIPEAQEHLLAASGR